MRALLDQLPGFAIDVKRELLVQIAFDPVRNDQGANAEFQVAEGHDVDSRHYRALVSTVNTKAAADNTRQR